MLESKRETIFGVRERGERGRERKREGGPVVRMTDAVRDSHWERQRDL